MDDLMKRAIARGDEELISPSRSDADVQAEMTQRGAKAGYMTKYGECSRRSKIMSRGFGDSRLNVWPRDKKGNLIQ